MVEVSKLNTHLNIHSLFAPGWCLWRSSGIRNLEDRVDRNRQDLGT